uniref:Uncharacterized protein LOC113799781 n=1 Tax=Dermatophagoides pteronyssinus TaxID=6956 RepID=A0A6P6YM45_DERPT|nr:uncharacterized protein LOC113799781 [Dermatophagoides pteronyssinus]
MMSATRRRASDLPINYAIAQEENQESQQNPTVSRSTSHSLLAQLSSSPYGWTTSGSSRSTSPTPPTMLSNSSLRRLPSNTVSGTNSRYVPQQSLQSLVKSFINKVSRGTQTDCDDNDDFDQLSIASLTSGFSAFENDFTRSRLKLFLNDSQFNDKSNNNIDEAEFVEELQKLRDQIDGRFKFGFESQPGSQSVSRQQSQPTSRPRSPVTTKIIEPLGLDLEKSKPVIETCDQSIETDRCCFEDKFTQADFGPSLSSIQQQQQTPSSSSFFSSFFSSSGQPEPAESFNVAIQTDLNLEHLCPLCKQDIQTLSINNRPPLSDSQQNLLKSQLLNQADMNNNSMEMTKSIDHGTQADMNSGDLSIDDDNDQKQTEGSNDNDTDKNEPPIAVKRKPRTTTATTNVVGVGSGHFYRGESSIKNNHNYVDLNGTSPSSRGNSVVIKSPIHHRSKDNDHVRPKCCNIS